MVDVHISNLRRKIDQAAPDVKIIQTVRGLGFRLSAEIVGDDA
jgi:two-component system OmpR family response regulator